MKKIREKLELIEKQADYSYDRTIFGIHMIAKEALALLDEMEDKGVQNDQRTND